MTTNKLFLDQSSPEYLQCCRHLNDYTYKQYISARFKIVQTNIGVTKNMKLLQLYLDTGQI